MKINKLSGIPKNTPYCYKTIGCIYLDEDGLLRRKSNYCKYFKLRKCGRRSKNFSTRGSTVYEYCKYLKKALSIGDSCKDCGISYGHDEDKIE